MFVPQQDSVRIETIADVSASETAKGDYIIKEVTAMIALIS
jgi:hypothetical protein